MSDPELWRPCLVDSRWQISNHGRVRGGIRFPLGIRKTSLQSSRYLEVRIAGTNLLVHRLVAQCFVRNPCPDIFDQVDHIDGDQYNNHWLNLRWLNSKLNNRNTKSKGWVKRGKKFVVQTGYNGKCKHHGTFETEHEAHSVYKKLQAEAFRSLYVELSGDSSLGLGPEKFLTKNKFKILAELRQTPA